MTRPARCWYETKPDESGLLQNETSVEARGLHLFPSFIVTVWAESEAGAGPRETLLVQEDEIPAELTAGESARPWVVAVAVAVDISNGSWCWCRCRTQSQA